MLPWAKTKNSWKNHKRYIFRGIRDLREQEISLKLKFLQGEMFSRWTEERLGNLLVIAGIGEGVLLLEN